MESISCPNITIVGSLNADLVTYTSRLPLPGETLTAHAFHTGPGGKGANQAVACGRLTRPSTWSQNHDSKPLAHVNMIGAVGEDLHGDMLVESLQKNGVAIDGISRAQGHFTGIAIIIVEETTGENRILLSPGANGTLRPERFTDLPSPLPQLIILQLEIPLHTVLRILSTAKKQGVLILLNPAPAQQLPDSAYACVTHLIMNETEAGILAASEEDRPLRVESREDLRRAADRFHASGVSNVIVTLGAKGVYFSTSKTGMQREHDGLVSAQKVKVIDTTAAGDTFVGAYAVEVVRHSGNFDIQAAVERANNIAAWTVQRKGAQESIPWLDTLG